MNRKFETQTTQHLMRFTRIGRRTIKPHHPRLKKNVLNYSPYSGFWAMLGLASRSALGMASTHLK